MRVSASTMKHLLINGDRQSDKTTFRDLADRNDLFGNIGCVIMASGEGKRFGGNKLMTDFKGKPMIQWTLEATDGIFVRRVVVTRHPDVQQLCESQKIPVVLHDLPYRNDTVRLGLEAVGQGLTGCVFCPGDQPLLTWDTVAALALCAKNNSKSIWRTAYGDTPGAPVYFPEQYFAELCHLPEGKGGNVIVRKNMDNVSFLVVSNRLELVDVDTRECMEQLAASTR